MKRRLPLLALLMALPLGACIDDERPLAPGGRTEDALFRRYVAMGNSITAGYMSGGINDSTQELAYPVLLAEMANADFGIPELARPGCPPPLTAVLDTLPGGGFGLNTDRVGGAASDFCALREFPSPDLLQNLAVPGAKIADAVLPPSRAPSPNTLTTLILGGESQIRAMQRAQPTMVTAWLGNNDALQGGLTGDLSLMTPVDTFAFYADELGSGISFAAPRLAILIGVTRPTQAPVLQPGLYYWVLDSLGISPKPVAADCAPTTGGVENDLASNLVSFLAYQNPAITTISCADDAPFVINVPFELDTLNTRVTAYNNALRGEAQSRGFLFLDPNVIVGAALGGAQGPNRIRQCTALDAGDPLPTIVQAVINTCPWPSAPNFWGSFISYDGVHPSAAAHQVIADAIAAAINSDQGTSL